MFTLKIRDDNNIHVCYTNKNSEQEVTHAVTFTCQGCQYNALNRQITPCYDKILNELRKRIIFSVKAITDLNSEMDGCYVSSNSIFRMYGYTYDDRHTSRPYTTDDEKKTAIVQILADQAVAVNSILYELFRREAIYAMMSYDRFIEQNPKSDELEMEIDMAFGTKLTIYMPYANSGLEDGLVRKQDGSIEWPHNDVTMHIQLVVKDGDQLLRAVHRDTSYNHAADVIIGMYYLLLFESQVPMVIAPVMPFSM